MPMNMMMDSTETYSQVPLNITSRHTLQIPYYFKKLRAAQQKLPVDLICFAVGKLEDSCSLSATCSQEIWALLFLLFLRIQRDKVAFHPVTGRDL